MDVTLPRETSEFLPIPVFDDTGVAVTDFEVAVTRWPERPTGWSAATVVGSDAGAVVAGLAHGTHQVWVRRNGTVVAAGMIWVD
jgi:hypothetical protein